MAAEVSVGSFIRSLDEERVRQELQLAWMENKRLSRQRDALLTEVTNLRAHVTVPGILLKGAD